MRSRSDGCGPLGGIVRLRNCIATFRHSIGSAATESSELASKKRIRLSVPPEWHEPQYSSNTGRMLDSYSVAASIDTLTAAQNIKRRQLCIRVVKRAPFNSLHLL